MCFFTGNGVNNWVMEGERLVDIKITENEAGQRLDRFLRKLLKDVSLGDIYKLFRKNKVKVNGKRCKENQMLELHDMVTLYMDLDLGRATETGERKENRQVKLDVVFEDNNILLVTKPAGLLTHPDEGKAADTMVDRALSYLSAKTENKSLTFSPAVCNRLDRNTGGIVIVAKNYKTLKAVNQIIRDRHIKKLYLCIIRGSISGKGELKNYLVKDEKSNRVSITDEKVKGASEIHTKYEVLKYNDEYSLLEVELVTGKSHQIRAHFASVNHPLIGDTKYGDNKVNRFFRENFKLEHQFLFASRIEFKEDISLIEELSDMHYMAGRSFMSKLPDKFSRIIGELF